MSFRLNSRRAALVAALVVGSCAMLVWADDAATEWKAPARAARKKNPVAVDEQSVAAGKALYTKNCLSCHGEAGKGDGTAATALEKPPGDLSRAIMWEQSDGALFWKLTEGRKPMPTFETLTSETERWQIINYVRTLAPKPAEPTSQPANN